MTPTLREHHPVSIFIHDRPKVQSRDGDGIGNSILDAFDVHELGAILLK
jgi:hypothetical protein